MPHGIKSLLGLGLSYCLQTPKPTNNLDDTLARFENDVRRISFFKHNPQPEEDKDVIIYTPGMYIKSDWTPHHQWIQTLNPASQTSEVSCRLTKPDANNQDHQTYHQGSGPYPKA